MRTPFLLGGLVATALGCTGVGPEPVAPPSLAPDASATAVFAGADAPPGERRFTCRVSAPVVSDDPCATDGDCVPAVPCHARTCAARNRAVPAAATTLCTRELVCDSVDANRCGCLNGRCALLPPG